MKSYGHNVDLFPTINILTWDDMLSQNKDNELIQLLKIGDVFTIDGEDFTILSAYVMPHLLRVRPHSGYLGDREFPIEKICESLTDEFIIERKLEKLNLDKT